MPALTRRVLVVTPATLSTHQMVIGITLIVVVAVACQTLAPRLRIPALVLLLPAGFALGMAVPSANAMAILGDAFGPVVDLVVAVILFQGGLELGTRGISRSDARTGLRLAWVGGVITWGVGTMLLALVIGLPVDIAVLGGVILSVSGPTVVNPLLEAIRPTKRVRDVLLAESTVLDPVGALAAVIVFQAIKADTPDALGTDLLRFLLGLAVGLGFAVAGLALTYLGIKVAGAAREVGAQVLLGGVVFAAGMANLVTDNAGLLAAVFMGIAAPYLSPRVGVDISVVRPFFDTIVSIAIGVLFVGISALVEPSVLVPLILPTLVVIAVLVLAVRPLVGFLGTVGRRLTWRERLFIGSMAPRGIVAAATAISVTTTLIALKVPGARDLVPVTFMVVAGTVLIYGLAAGPMATLLGIREEDSEE